jgi:hypothetical protein
MIEAFKAIRFKLATLALIVHANGIIGEYQALGFVLTLRQLFYQFVSRPALGLANTFDDYKWLGRTVTDARRAGLIDWDAIEDRTRNVHRLPTWDDPPEIVASCAEQYREDLWASQRYRPEIWIEKDALTGVIEEVCDELRTQLLLVSRQRFGAGDVRRGQTLRPDCAPRPSSDRPAFR